MLVDNENSICAGRPMADGSEAVVDPNSGHKVVLKWEKGSWTVDG